MRLGESRDWTPETLGHLLVDTPGGAKLPLKMLAQITKTTGPNTISREQVERKIVVMCNVAGRDVASVVQDIAKAVNPMLAAQPGYSVAYGGQFESAEAAGRLLGVLGVAVIVGIGFLLSLAFGSLRDAALIMVNLPLALIGGIAGVYVSGGVLSVASLIGFITVFGIATRNGIMLVSHIRHLQEQEGVTDFRTAVFQGAMERLSPILMTALAAGLALVPLASVGRSPATRFKPHGDCHPRGAPHLNVSEHGGRASALPAFRASPCRWQKKGVRRETLLLLSIAFLLVIAGLCDCAAPREEPAPRAHDPL